MKCISIPQSWTAYRLNKTAVICHCDILIADLPPFRSTQDWCCRHKGVACSPPPSMLYNGPYNCHKQPVQVWSLQKRLWCCQNYQAGIYGVQLQVKTGLCYLVLLGLLGFTPGGGVFFHSSCVSSSIVFSKSTQLFYFIIAYSTSYLINLTVISYQNAWHE